MKKSLLICWGMLLTLFAQAQGHEERLAAIDMQHYDFKITISDSSDRIYGKATLKLELLQPAAHIVLDLVAVGDGGKGMQVRDIHALAGGAYTFVHQGESLDIQLGATQPKGSVIELEIAYEGIPADGLIISENKRDGRSFFGDNWPNRAHHWLPTVDHPSDKATVDFTVIAPAHYEIVANGKLQAQRVAPNGQQISHWHNEEPLPTKVMVFGAADFALQDVGMVGGIPVSTWVFAADETAGFHDYAQGKEILQWYVTNVGIYPWDKLANVQSRTRYGGMENASCIFYADNSVTGDGSCEALMAHEIAHQWFGNSASEANWYHIWLSEGFATYWTHLYFESKYGIPAFQKRMVADRSAIVGSGPFTKLAIVDPRIQDLNQLLNVNSYQKGGWVLHMLRCKLGNDLFYKGIRAYYARYQFGNALSEDLQAVMENTSGQNLNAFFQQWLYRPGFPELDVVWAWKKGKKEITLTVTQTQAGTAFEFPLEITALDADGKPLGEWSVDMKTQSQKVTFPLAALPSKVVLDPHVKLLFQGKARQN